MSRKTKKLDKNDNPIGDGRYHVDYEVYDFKEYPQISHSVSKSENTESVYVRYYNKENMESVTVRFSWHENNATKFGDQLNGNLTSKDDVLIRLGIKIKYNGKIVLLTKKIKEEIEKNKEIEAEKSKQKAEILFNFSRKLESKGFSIKHNPRTYQNIEEFTSKKENRPERLFVFQKKIDVNAYEYYWLEKTNEFIIKKLISQDYYDFLQSKKIFELVIEQKLNSEQILKKFKDQLEIELSACGTGIFPKICALNETDRGFEEIFKNVYQICSSTGMSIGSALAQYESDL